MIYVTLREGDISNIPRSKGIHKVHNMQQSEHGMQMEIEVYGSKGWIPAKEFHDFRRDWHSRQPISMNQALEYFKGE